MVRNQVWSELTLSPSAEATDPSGTALFLQWHLQFLGDSFPNVPVTAQGEKSNIFVQMLKDNELSLQLSFVMSRIYSG